MLVNGEIVMLFGQSHNFIMQLPLFINSLISSVCFAYSLQLKIILLSSVDHNFDNCLSSLPATQTFQILAYEI